MKFMSITPKAVVSVLLALPLFVLSCGKVNTDDEGGSTAEPAASGWMELPQDISDDDLHWVKHYMTLGGNLVRNWSCCYSYSDKISYWVAYPLNKAYIGSYFGRSDAWAYDPDVPSQYQYNVTSTYGGGWTRGHQIPSADRQGNYEINASTYYSTNMTPQEYTFNGGTWASLEGQVRNWALKSDTLYVVTGAVPSNKTTSSGVNIPEAYFKALLRYMPGSTIGIDGYCGLAFWFNHSQWSGSEVSVNSGMAISISDLEKKLGYDLFPNLHTLIGNSKAKKVKQENPQKVSWWWN